jgi:hypothetical protein
VGYPIAFRLTSPDDPKSSTSLPLRAGLFALRQTITNASPTCNIDYFRNRFIKCGQFIDSIIALWSRPC